jgi:hypothetical protein
MLLATLSATLRETSVPAYTITKASFLSMALRIINFNLNIARIHSSVPY